MVVGIWDVLPVIAKAAMYAATLSAAGGVFFLLYNPGLSAGSDVRIRRLLRWLTIAACLASGARIFLIAGSMSGDFRGMFDRGLDRMVLQTGEGGALAVRVIGLVLMLGSGVGTGGSVGGGNARARMAGGNGRCVVAVVGAVAAATSFGLVGHVHALAGIVLPTLVIDVHLLAAAFWLGALGPLLIVLEDADFSRAADASRAARVVLRFGQAAVAAVAALVVAGIGLLSLLLHTVSDLWTGTYGRFVLVKLGFVGCLLLMAAHNHARLTPRLQRGDTGSAAGLKRSIIAEIIFAGCVLLVTAAMTTLTGPEAG